MKLRHPAAIRAAAWLGGTVFRACMSTLRVRYVPLGPGLDPRREGMQGRYLYAFWHENLLLPAFLYGRSDIHVLISRHADGQVIAEVVESLGFRTVRGSSRRGAVPAALGMLRAADKGHLAITPDGPRGPRRRVQPGIAYLAARSGLPVVAVGVAYDDPWRVNSWDCFAVPRPFSRAAVVTGEPITVPANAEEAELEAAREQIELAMHDLTGQAERVARGLEPRPVCSLERVAVPDPRPPLRVEPVPAVKEQ
jgi:lysophospholipid acyltransferase (LPLAT)-like uncharacterized protein